jgi:hypothetical protein
MVPQPGYPQYAPRPPKDRSIAMILEILPGLFGLLGIGWIYSGNTTTGLIWLFGVLAMNLFIWVPVILLTAGFGCICSWPVNLVLLIVSTITLNSYTKQHPELFGP